MLEEKIRFTAAVAPIFIDRSPIFNPLNAEINHISHLLALVGVVVMLKALNLCRKVVILALIPRSSKISLHSDIYTVSKKDCTLFFLFIFFEKGTIFFGHLYIYICFRTFFYDVLHLDSIASYLHTGLHLGLFRSWPSLFLPSSFSSIFLVFSFVLASTSALSWAIFPLPFFGHGRSM